MQIIKKIKKLGQVVFVLLNAHFLKSASFADVASAKITRDIVHILLRLLGISNRSKMQ
jgi:hypothetical protein